MWNQLSCILQIWVASVGIAINHNGNGDRQWQEMQIDNFWNNFFQHDRTSIFEIRWPSIGLVLIGIWIALACCMRCKDIKFSEICKIWLADNLHSFDPLLGKSTFHTKGNCQLETEKFLHALHHYALHHYCYHFAQMPWSLHYTFDSTSNMPFAGTNTQCTFSNDLQW